MEKIFVLDKKCFLLNKNILSRTNLILSKTKNILSGQMDRAWVAKKLPLRYFLKFVRTGDAVDSWSSLEIDHWCDGSIFSSDKWVLVQSRDKKKLWNCNGVINRPSDKKIAMTTFSIFTNVLSGLICTWKIVAVSTLNWADVSSLQKI